MLTCTPTPVTSTTTAGVNAAAWNQRRLVHIQARPASETRPAAQIGVVAVSTSSAADTVKAISRCPTAARIRNGDITPNTVATVASVMSWVEKSAHGCHADHVSTPSRALINDAVRPWQAANTAAA